MHSLTRSHLLGSILFFVLFVHPKNVSAVAVHVQERGISSSCCIGCADDDVDIAPTNDGPTSDRSPGIGVEFETSAITFNSATANAASTYPLKGKLVNGRQGPNWQLTADTTGDSPGVLYAEYILDGRTIKIGTGVAAVTANLVAQDLANFNPWSTMPNPAVIIGSDTRNDWRIGKPTTGGAFGSMRWAPQVTAPLPLESINDLFSKALAGTRSTLLPYFNANRNIVYVTKDFFQSSPNGISPEKVTDDVLGFFSLILSYAKSATEFQVNASPKGLTSIMPRSDFSTIFAQVKSKIPLTPMSLYQIMSVLGCYANEKGDVVLDDTYCTGTPAKPVVGDKMDAQTFTVRSSTKTTQPLTVQDWILSVQAGEMPDALSVLDKAIDSQIGGLGSTLENVLDTTRAVPLFEFRNLESITSSQMQSMVTNAEIAIIAYHHTNAVAPQSMIARHVKRQGTDAACSAQGDPSPSPSPSPSPPPSPSPVSSSAPHPPSTVTGPASASSTFSVHLSNNSMPMGELDDEDGGATLRTTLYKKLLALCPDDSHSCSSTTKAEFDDVLTVVDGNPVQETIEFTITDSGYETTDDRDRMLALSISMWERATAKSCKQVEYSVSIIDHALCGTSPPAGDVPPSKRSLSNITELVQRTPVCEDTCEPPGLEPTLCTYTTTICAGPNGIHSNFESAAGNPYANFMDIDLTWKLDGDPLVEFFCDLLVETISEAAVAVAPELAEADLFADIEFETLCADLANEAISN